MSVEWKISPGLTSYEEAMAFMDERVAKIYEGSAEECIWLLEHPPLYTAGTSAKKSDLLSAQFPVYESGRGGQYTYHGPGQRIVYVMLDLKKRQSIPDVRKYVCDLERWIIASLKPFGIDGQCRDGRIGIWVNTAEGDKKIAAIGVRIRHWITLHGLSINVTPDLSHFDGIVPCGITEHGVTSIEALGIQKGIVALDQALKANLGILCPEI